MLDLNELQNENERLTAESNNFSKNFVKLPDGKCVVTIRFLPPAVGGKFGRVKNNLFQRTRLHMINGKAFHCPRELQSDGWFKGPCPICEYYTLLWKESKSKSPEESKHDQQLARQIKAVERYYYNCIVRSETDPDTGKTIENVGPKIFACGKTMHAKIITGIVGSEELEEPGYGDVTDPITGRDFKIIKGIKKGPDGVYPEYDKSKYMDPSPLGTPDQVQKWLEDLHDLQALRVLKSYDELHHQLRVHFGLAKDESIGFDVSEFRTGVPKSTVTVQKSADADDGVGDVDDSVGDVDASVVEDDFMKDLENEGLRIG
jgi:hypothetical protein